MTPQRMWKLFVGVLPSIVLFFPVCSAQSTDPEVSSSFGLDTTESLQGSSGSIENDIKHQGSSLAFHSPGKPSESLAGKTNESSMLKSLGGGMSRKQRVLKANLVKYPVVPGTILPTQVFALSRIPGHIVALTTEEKKANPVEKSSSQTLIPDKKETITGSSSKSAPPDPHRKKAKLAQRSHVAKKGEDARNIPRASIQQANHKPPPLAVIMTSAARLALPFQTEHRRIKSIETSRDSGTSYKIQAE